jgi:hypothetical protein
MRWDVTDETPDLGVESRGFLKIRSRDTRQIDTTGKNRPVLICDMPGMHVAVAKIERTRSDQTGPFGTIFHSFFSEGFIWLYRRLVHRNRNCLTLDFNALVGPAASDRVLVGGNVDPDQGRSIERSPAMVDQAHRI